MTEKFQAKGKFVSCLACPQDLNVAYLTVESGIIKLYQEIGRNKGKFFATATGHFNEITGYFWGFHKTKVYSFDVNEIQFTFELAFDKNNKLYPALFNTCLCGWGVHKLRLKR